jgi:UDP-N-acetylmuramate dehydrogenase
MASAATLNDSFKKLKESFNLFLDEPMKKHTSIKVGGPADLFAMPETLDELINIIKTAHEENIDLTIVGDGTNLLVKDKGIRGLVVSTCKFKNIINSVKTNPDTVILTASSGTKLSSLCNYAIKNNLQGLEFTAGIPGTLGGAIAMNAGTPSGSMSEIVESIKILTNKGDILIIKKEDLNFSYRNLENLIGIIIEASLLFKKGDSAKIQDNYNQHLKAKKTNQPLSSKSAGCFFKNPVDSEPAGKLIDMAGLKGKRIGDAAISETHANFIINMGQATCEDILKLKQFVKTTILNLYSVELHSEIIIKGEQE